MTPMKLKTMGDVLFEGLLVFGGSLAISDTLNVGITVAGSVSVDLVDPVTPSTMLTVVESPVHVLSSVSLQMNIYV